VVWWDPYLLDETPAGKPGIRRYQILQPNEELAEDIGARTQEQWRTRREATLEQGSRSSLLIMTATKKAEEAVSLPDEVEVEVIQRVRGRPVGKAFGSLVHEVLAATDFDSDRQSLSSLASSLGRMFANTEKEIEAATEAARRALEHPLLRRAAAAELQGLCHRETPIVYRDPEGTLIEGVPDLAFRDDAGSPWTLVDFKTDIRIDMGQEEYKRQVAIYMEALRQATGAEAKGILLYV
jgi:ATP-dependent exoDNAse (exonuclease V) beta subunit